MTLQFAKAKRRGVLLNKQFAFINEPSSERVLVLGIHYHQFLRQESKRKREVERQHGLAFLRYSFVFARVFDASLFSSECTLFPSLIV